MSRLPNAPLLEVIFELRWEIINKNDIIEFQYLHGDLYSKLRGDYKVRQNLLPPEIPFDAVKGIPVYRFRKEQDEYPLIQLGPGLITVNTIDKNYYWNEFKAEIDKTLNCFEEVYPKFLKLNTTPSLIYVDFFEINDKSESYLDFIERNLNISISQNFINEKENKVNNVDLTLNYQLGEDILSLSFKKGLVKNKQEGLIMQSKILGKQKIYNLEQLSNWINDSHNKTRDIFKKIIKPEFYKTFN